MRRSVRRAFTAIALGFVFASPARAQAPSPDPAALPQVVPVTATRLTGEIKLDGVLEDGEWSGAGRIETFLRVYFPQSLRGVAVGEAPVAVSDRVFHFSKKGSFFRAVSLEQPARRHSPSRMPNARRKIDGSFC